MADPKITSPARQAVWRWIYRSAGFAAALRYAFWVEFLDSGIEAAEIAKRLGWRSRKVWRVTLDAEQRIKIDTMSDFMLALGKEIVLTARDRQTGELFARHGAAA